MASAAAFKGSWHNFCFLLGVKKQNSNYFSLIVAIFGLFLVNSCSKVNKIKDVFDEPSAREKYERDFDMDPTAFIQWKEVYENALFDSVAVALPYSEAGKFSPVIPKIFTYNFSLNPGERLRIEVETDSLNPLVFLDLYQQKTDSLKTFEHLSAAKFNTSDLQQEIKEPGVYKLILQPEINAVSSFVINIFKEPVYIFPVSGKGNSAVHSVWGAARDGGRRSHEGIDIFAPRGTPVVAVTAGRVSSTGNKGLGGKQVWLRDNERGNSLYYAHLDSVIASPGQRVNPGDTLGLVGNTGNAKTTAPHLHFGIYKGYKGAQDPLPYVYITPSPTAISPEISSDILITSATANLRKGPSTKAQIATRVQPNDTLNFLGETADWYHTRQGKENFFIHKSLARPL